MSLRLKYILSIVAIALALSSSAILFYAAYQQINRFSDESRQTLFRLAQLSEVTNVIVKMSAAIDAYALTGHGHQLTQYRLAHSEVDETLKQLIEEEAGSPANSPESLSANDKEHAHHQLLHRLQSNLQEWETQIANPIIEQRQQLPLALLELTDRIHNQLTQILTLIHAEQSDPEELQLLSDKLQEEALEVMSLNLPVAQHNDWLWLLQRINELHDNSASPYQNHSAIVHQLLLRTNQLSSMNRMTEKEIQQLLLSGLSDSLLNAINKDWHQYLLYELQNHSSDKLTANIHNKLLIAMSPTLPAALILILLTWMLINQLGFLNKAVRTSRALSQGKYDARLNSKRKDELGSIARALNRLAEQLESEQQLNKMLHEFRQMLYSCNGDKEAYQVTERFARKGLGNTAGGVFLINESRSLVDGMAFWNKEQLHSQECFSPTECWALKSGQEHLIQGDDNDLPCTHIKNPQRSTLCLPLIAHDEILGIMYVESLNAEHNFTPQEIHVAETLVEQVSRTIAGIKLHSVLEEQSIRDPMTGLFNRRYLEVTFERELIRAERMGTPLSLVILDIDHFKQFNDTFGHDAGDYVINEVANILINNVRGDDIPCRYGGEEFLLLFPNCALTDATARAESIRQKVSHLTLEHYGKNLGNVTISLGVAGYPECTNNMNKLIKFADEALYQSKERGRNQVTCVTSGKENNPDSGKITQLSGKMGS